MPPHEERAMRYVDPREAIKRICETAGSAEEARNEDH